MTVYRPLPFTFMGVRKRPVAGTGQCRPDTKVPTVRFLRPFSTLHTDQFRTRKQVRLAPGFAGWQDGGQLVVVRELPWVAEVFVDPFQVLTG